MLTAKVYNKFYNCIIMVKHQFSWEDMAAIAQDIKVRRAHSMILNNPQFRKEHPDWARDAEKKNYVIMDKMIKEKTKKAQERAIERRKQFGV